MKHIGERGFTAIEVILSLGLVSLIGLGALQVSYQTMHMNQKTQTSLLSSAQLENAGYWITRDAQMAEGITTDGLDWPDFITMTWTEWVLGGNPVYDSVTYYFDNFSNNIGTLKRHHWSTAGIDTTTVVGQYIYYHNGNPPETSVATFTNPDLTVRLTSMVGNDKQKQTYKIIRRPDFNW